MKMMILALFVPFLAQAENHEGHGNFEERKTKMLSHIEERIQQMSKHKDCVSAAKDAEGLKACRHSMKEWREDQREERGERKAKRQQRREERKKSD